MTRSSIFAQLTLIVTFCLTVFGVYVEQCFYCHLQCKEPMEIQNCSQLGVEKAQCVSVEILHNNKITVNKGCKRLEDPVKCSANGLIDHLDSPPYCEARVCDQNLCNGNLSVTTVSTTESTTPTSTAGTPNSGQIVPISQSYMLTLFATLVVLIMNLYS